MHRSPRPFVALRSADYRPPLKFFSANSQLSRSLITASTYFSRWLR